MKKIFLILVLAFAFFLRIWQIDQNPPSLNWDEVSHGYNAYSILKTDKDEWGVKFPLIFRAYGDYKLPVYIYLTAVSESIFGLNPFSVRLVSVLSGLGLVLLAYLITRKITKNEGISLFSAFLTALSPWSLFLSRVAVEANLAASLFALGIYFLFDWLEDHSLKSLILLALFWGFSLHTYNSARLLVPLFTVAVAFLVVRAKQFRQLVVFLSLIFIFFVPVINQFFDESGSARFGWVSLIDQGTINRIIEKRTNSSLPAFASKILYNRPSFFIFYAAKNYLSNLSPDYLFFRGGSHYQFSQVGHELLFLVSAPFLLIGLLKILVKGNPKERVVMLWFFLAFIPSAITRDAPHVLRSILILPTPMILSSLGLEWMTGKISNGSFFKGQLIIWVLIISVLISFYKWWGDYQNIYPKAYSWAWQYGYKELVGFLKENYAKYDKIIITKKYGEPHEFILFWWPWDPQKFRDDPSLIRYFRSDWYWIDGFDKFLFANDWEIDKVGSGKWEVGSGRKLLITSPGNYPEGWRKIETINFLDEKPVFEILEK
ncbi:MAG: ArnT family glycosyltransferase [Patescibacteria group bacterium]